LLNAKSALEATINDGKISAKKQATSGAPILQTNTAATHGNSGGPVLNDANEVIGLLTFRGDTVGGQEVSGFSFIVPSNTVMEYVKSAGATNTEGPTDINYREGLGSAVVFKALMAGDVDAYVEYAGTLWTSEMGRSDNPPPEQMRAEIARYLIGKGGARLLGPLGFENAYAFAMRQPEAQRRGIATLDDLARASPQLTLGTDLEFLDRPEWAAVRRAYPFRFARQKRYSPTFMYRALASGDADVITAFSSDGRIAADRLTVLADPKRAIPNYDAILLVSARCASQPKCMDALRPLVGGITVEAMREANFLVDRDRDKQSPAAAAGWLAANTGLAR